MIERSDIWWVEEVFDDDTIQIVNDSFKVKPSKKAFEEANKMDFIELSRLRSELQEFEDFLVSADLDETVSEFRKRFSLVLDEKEKK